MALLAMLKRRYLRCAILLYLVVVTVLLYEWKTSFRPEAKHHSTAATFSFKSLTSFYRSELHKGLQKGAEIQKEHKDNRTLSYNEYLGLFVAQDTTLLSNRTAPVRTVWESSGQVYVTERLRSAFETRLECQEDFHLGFLGMESHSVDLREDPACLWLKGISTNEEKTFVAFGEEMAALRHVTLDPDKFTGTPGGEKISEVFLQKEGEEYFKVQPGFFTLPCKTPPKAKFHVDKRNYRRNNHLNSWTSSIRCTDTDAFELTSHEKGKAANSIAHNDSSSNDRKTDARTDLARSDVMTRELNDGIVRGVTLAIQRYEYANVYHTMLDWYNAFLAVLLLGINPRHTTFLIVDGHPWGKLDSSWAALFGGRAVLRAGHLPRATTFEYMVWVANGYHSPLFNTDRKQVPFLPELRHFFFESYGVQAKNHTDCSRLSVLLIRRRDYLAHPRNPRGMLQRKMANEDEVLHALGAAMKGHVVQAVQLDLLPMAQQLKLIGDTDILVGMHGAAMTYSALLHDKAAVVELFPKYVTKLSVLFSSIARWRGHHYVRWHNQDSANEKRDFYTRVPPDVVVKLVTEMVQKMCKDS